MKDFLNRLQKDINRMQDTFEKESNDLLNRARKAANDIAKNNNVAERRKDLERLVEQKMKKFEPALYKFLSEVSKNAAKYGLDVTDMERRVKTSYRKAKRSVSKLNKKKKTTKKKSTTSKKATTARKKSTTKKPGAKKKTTTKKTTKKASS